MRLFHYSAKPLALPLYSREQDAREDQLTHNKPKGFWFSVEGKDDWPHWCQEEGFRIEALAHAHEIRLAPDAKIVRLSSATDIDLFTERYARATKWSFGRREAIAWSEVAQHHQGIIIAPYIWSRRLNGGSDWYYGWDCASGCVWDVSAIAEVASEKERAES